MQIKVLGTRGEIKAPAPRHSRHSGVLIDNTILLDLGEKEFLEYKPKSIFITHLHPDHAFFITGEKLNTDIPVYAPEPSRESEKVIPISDPIQLESYRITPVPTHHSKLVKSTAYLIDNGEQKLLYTGDMIRINKEHHHLLTGLKLVITDGSYLRQGGMVRKDKETGQLYGHNGIPDLINLFQHFSRHILFIHFGSWFFKDIEEAREKLERLGKSRGTKIHIGYDGMEIDLDQLQ